MTQVKRIVAFEDLTFDEFLTCMKMLGMDENGCSLSSIYWNALDGKRPTAYEVREVHAGFRARRFKSVDVTDPEDPILLREEPF